MTALHPRAAIRQKVVTLLVAAMTSAGTRVEASRVYPWRSSQLPAIAVYTDGDDVERESTKGAPREYERHVDLVIEGAVILDDHVDDAMDALEIEILAVMHANRRLEGTASDTTLRGTELLEGKAGERPIGVIRLTFDAKYFQDASAQKALADLDDFRRAHVEYSLPDPTEEDPDARQAPDDRVVDDITIQPEPEPEPPPEEP